MKVYYLPDGSPIVELRREDISNYIGRVLSYYEQDLLESFMLPRMEDREKQVLLGDPASIATLLLTLRKGGETR